MQAVNLIEISKIEENYYFKLKVLLGDECHPLSGPDSVHSWLEIDRSLSQLKYLERQLRSCHHTDNRMPSAKIKLLVNSSPWKLNDTGWHVQLKSSVRIFDEWLCTTFTSLRETTCLSNFMDNEWCRRTEDARLTKKVLEADPRRFQQYFISDENKALMIRRCKEWSLESDNTLFLEPSCGQGDLLTGLVAEGWSCVGCDIDPVVCDRARETLARLATELSPETFAVPVPVITQDFLTVTRASLMDVAAHGRPHDTTGVDQHMVVVVVGCPPYTCGGGTGALTAAGSAESDTGRDLPLHFIVHCANTIGADKMLFLLPPRCGDPAFIGRVRTAISRGHSQRYCHGHSDGSTTTTSSRTVPESESGMGWNVVNSESASNLFYFCGREVHQPAIIQSWERTNDTLTRTLTTD
eukprot:gene1214-2364_t